AAHGVAVTGSRAGFCASRKTEQRRRWLPNARSAGVPVTCSASVLPVAVAGAARSVQRVTPVESYRVYSEHYGAGDPVVLLHGLSGSQRWWRYAVPALAREYEVHVLDLVGHGRSRRARRPPEISEKAAPGRARRAWIERIGIDRPHLVGHSMRGQIAIHIAAGDLALRSLTLVDAAGLPRRVTLREITRFMAGVLPPRAWGVPHFIPTIWLDAMRA